MHSGTEEIPIPVGWGSFRDWDVMTLFKTSVICSDERLENERSTHSNLERTEVRRSEGNFDRSTEAILSFLFLLRDNIELRRLTHCTSVKATKSRDRLEQEA